MTESQNAKPYDLEVRTFQFARNVRGLVKQLPTAICHQEYGRQVIRSSGSVGANYIEANESLSKKDFLLRIKICRKEAKESSYWLRLIDVAPNEILERHKDALAQEATELMSIFGAILRKTE